MSSRNTFILSSIAVLPLVLMSFVANAATISSGYSGMWYDPARSGEGLQLDILDADKAVVYWFTYDDSGKQRWFGGIGQIAHGGAGDSIQFPDMYVTQGGKFGAGFNPDDVKFQTVGNVSLMFSDCKNGTFKYTAFGQSQTLPIQRLTQTMGAGCQSINGVPGEPVMPYAGQSGNWFDTAHSGEGFDLHWMSNGQAIVSWYTYDTQGNQVWLMGAGSPQNGSIVFNHLFSTSGPKFGAAFDPMKYQEHDWGSLTMTLNCDTGTAHYASTQAGFGSGDFTVTRLTALRQPACPYVQPKFSDLYTIAWDEIPVSNGTSADPNAVAADDIANDGTLAGRLAGHLVLWHPDTRTWEDIPRDIAPGYYVYISPDATRVIANDVLVGNLLLSKNILLWQRSTGWQILTGNGFSESAVTGVSKNFKFIAGIGTNDEVQLATWIQAIDGVQQILPQGAYPNTSAFAVSDDGNVTIGETQAVPNDWPGYGFVGAVWIGAGLPQLVRDPMGNYIFPTCISAAGDIMYGAGTQLPEAPYASNSQPYFLKLNGTFSYMGQLADELRSNDESIGTYRSKDTTSDGTLALGLYVVGAQQPPAPYMEFWAPYLWTQATGMISVWALASELGIGDMDWSTVDLVRLSADGMQLLIYGKRKTQPDQARAVVLHLTPKVGTN